VEKKRKTKQNYLLLEWAFAHVMKGITSSLSAVAKGWTQWPQISLPSSWAHRYHCAEHKRRIWPRFLLLLNQTMQAAYRQEKQFMYHLVFSKVFWALSLLLNLWI